MHRRPLIPLTIFTTVLATTGVGCQAIDATATDKRGAEREQAGEEARRKATTEEEANKRFASLPPDKQVEERLQALTEHTNQSRDTVVAALVTPKPMEPTRTTAQTGTADTKASDAGKIETQSWRCPSIMQRIFIDGEMTTERADRGIVFRFAKTDKRIKVTSSLFVTHTLKVVSDNGDELEARGRFPAGPQIKLHLSRDMGFASIRYDGDRSHVFDLACKKSLVDAFERGRARAAASD